MENSMIVKDIWANEDFESMSWHDSRIYSISFPDGEGTMTLDVDYIFQWDLIEDKFFYKFWVSPCSLSFLDVFNLKIDIDFSNSLGLDIDNIKCANERLLPNARVKLYDYIIETDKGYISFESSGFIQKVIRQPVFSNGQSLSRPFSEK